MPASLKGPKMTAPISRTLPAPRAYLCGLTWDGTTLWHSDQDAKRIFAIDPETGAVLRELHCARVRADLCYDGTHLGQVGGRPKRILLLDPETGQITGEKSVLPASGRLTGTEFGPEGIWMCLRGPTVVQLRDYATMTVQREYPARGESPSGLTYADGLIIYGDFADAVLRAMSPQTGEILGEVPVSGRPTGMTWDGERLWYCDFPARSLRAVELSAVLAGSLR
jgi:outer membrane protein assembly factor BamB